MDLLVKICAIFPCQRTSQAMENLAKREFGFHISRCLRSRQNSPPFAAFFLPQMLNFHFRITLLQVMKIGFPCQQKTKKTVLMEKNEKLVPRSKPVLYPLQSLCRIEFVVHYEHRDLERTSFSHVYCQQLDLLHKALLLRSPALANRKYVVIQHVNVKAQPAKNNVSITIGRGCYCIYSIFGRCRYSFVSIKRRCYLKTKNMKILFHIF